MFAAEARHYFELAQERIRTGAIGPDKGDWNEAIIRLHDTARQLEFLEPLEDVSADQHMWADVVDDLNSVCKAIQSLLTSLRRKLTKDQQDILDRVAENFWKGIKKHNRRVIGSTYDTSEEEDESDVDERTV